MAAIGLDLTSLPLLEKPSEAQLKVAYSELKQFNAIEETKLTEIGKQMSVLPIEPHLARVLVASLDEEFLAVRNDIINLVAVMQSDSVFYTPAGKREEVREAREKFLNDCSDHITLLNVFNEWQRNKSVDWSKVRT